MKISQRLLTGGRGGGGEALFQGADFLESRINRIEQNFGSVSNNKRPMGHNAHLN